MLFFYYSYYFSSIVKVVIYAGSKVLVSWNQTIRVGTKYADAWFPYVNFVLITIRAGVFLGGFKLTT